MSFKNSLRKSTRIYQTLCFFIILVYNTLFHSRQNKMGHTALCMPEPALLMAICNSDKKNEVPSKQGVGTR